VPLQGRHPFAGDHIAAFGEAPVATAPSELLYRAWTGFKSVSGEAGSVLSRQTAQGRGREEAAWDQGPQALLCWAWTEALNISKAL